MALVLKTLPQVTVATPGTEQPVSSATLSNVVSVIISAPAANTGAIYVGDANVAVGRGIEIAKGTSVTIMAPTSEMIDIKLIFVDAATANDKANISYLQRAVG